MTRPQTQGGFTLVELLVTVVIMTIIISGITVGLIVVLNTYPSDATRLTQDEGAQLLSSWLQADVLSAGPTYGPVGSPTPPMSGIDVSGTAAACAGSLPTALRVTWGDGDSVNPHAFEASYALS